MKVDLSKYKHRIEIFVRYDDLDTMRHVNNKVYLSYLEEARINYFEQSSGFDKKTLDFKMVVARVDVSYRRPIEIGDKVELYTRCSRIGNKSVEFESIFIKTNPKTPDIQELASYGSVVLVSVDSETGLSTENSLEMVEKIKQFEGII